MLEAMRRCGGVQTRAADVLGMTFRSFRYFAKKYCLIRDVGFNDGGEMVGAAGRVRGQDD